MQGPLRSRANETRFGAIISSLTTQEPRLEEPFEAEPRLASECSRLNKTSEKTADESTHRYGEIGI